MRRKFFPGVKRGRLTLVRIVDRKDNRDIWLCKCDCGNEKKVNAQNFSHGTCRSCGCLQKEHAYRLGKSHIGKKGNSARNAAINTYKRVHHYKDQRAWGLTDEYAEHLLTSNCAYCGSLPSVKEETQSGTFIHGGIDRVDSNKGYVIGNVVPACWLCNCMKNKFSKELFLSHIEKIKTFQLEKSATGRGTLQFHS